MGLAKLATCNLNQWAMDFKGNLERIVESIREAKAAGCTFRCGPELEITGYGCEDYFLEQDTFQHSWDSLARLLDSDVTNGIICDVSGPRLSLITHPSETESARRISSLRRLACP